jgi:peptide/nickel transport system substrate-binding protein
MKSLAKLRGRRVAVLSALACTGVALVIASTVSAHPSTVAAGGTLTIAEQGTINTFDPWGPGIGLNGSMMYEPAVYDELLHLSNTGKIVPWLATSWKVNGRDITMTLRQGVQFVDGTAFNAAAVKANLDYAQSTKTPGQCNGFLKAVVTNVTGTYSVRLHLRQPNPDLLLNMATCAGYMVSPQALKNPAGLTTTPDGTGPYTYDPSASVQGQKWVFNKRANYWNPAAYPFSTVVFTFFRDQTAADNAGRSGQIDFLQVVPVTDTSSGMRILKGTPNLVRGMAIADTAGELVPALGNKLVRQAMNYAIDRKAILKSIYNGIGVVNGGSTPFTSSSPGYSKSLDTLYPYNPAKARALLKQAGYAKGFSFTVMDSPTDTNSAMLQAIAGFERKVGVNMQIAMNSTTFIPSMLSGQNPAFFAQYTLSGAQYQNLYGLASAHAFWNPRHKHIKVFDRLLTRLLYATGTKADALYAQFAQAFSDEAWWVMPVTLPNAAGYNAAKIKPYVTNQNPCPLLYQIRPA